MKVFQNIKIMSFLKFDEKNSFCISLETSFKRREKMKLRFEKMNMNVSIINASTPDDLIFQFNDRLSPKEKACSQSHILIWKTIIEKKLDYALILEDDVCFDYLWKEKLSELNVKENDNWNAIFLNTSETSYPLFKWTTAVEQYLCGAYILSKEGATLLLNMYQNEFHTSDWMTTRMQIYGNCYTYFPWLAIQEGCDSTIRGDAYIRDNDKVVHLLNGITYDINNYMK